jgi:hypothetical protein
MAGQEQSGGTIGPHAARLSATDLIARVQRLADANPTDAGKALEWLVSAYFLGDVSALASVSLRARR